MRNVIIAPHVDDEMIGCYSLLQKRNYISQVVYMDSDLTLIEDDKVKLTTFQTILYKLGIKYPHVCTPLRRHYETKVLKELLAENNLKKMRRKNQAKRHYARRKKKRKILKTKNRGPDLEL